MIAFQPAACPHTPHPELVEGQPVEAESVASRMADAMIEIAFSGQTVDAQALALRGFTSAERDAYAVQALEIANARAIKRVS